MSMVCSHWQWTLLTLQQFLPRHVATYRMPARCFLPGWRLGGLVGVADVSPRAGVGAGALALLLPPVALVMLFLPPANRYRTARRAGTR